MLWVAARHLKDEHLALEIESGEMRFKAWVQLMAHEVIKVGRTRIAIANIVNEPTTPGQRR
ncbi:hypothetical protein KSC_028370 [Ktedonobacter sp. SOSP1-52]|nr:hypothetical protein KSC_028370 [Ktedonobacter sp. SOSP1-52]